MSRKIVALIGVVCGLELVAAAVIGGAGMAAVFGTEGLIVGTAIVLFAALTVVHRRNRVQPEGQDHLSSAPTFQD